MVEKMSFKFVAYLNRHLELSEDDQSKIKYVFQLLVGDFTKLLILLALFTCIGQTGDFLVAATVLLLIRPFTGGLHFKTYWGCFSFSLAFFSGVLLAAHFISLSPLIMIISYLLCMMTITIIGPLPSASRPKCSADQIKGFKIKACGVIMVNLIALILTKNNPSCTIAFWVIFIQTIQIIVRKGGLYYEIQRSCENPR